MQQFCSVVLLGLALPLASAAQAPCSPDALPTAAKTVASIRHGLHSQAVGELDPKVPATVATQLKDLKEALGTATDAAFACADHAATAETLEKTLATALHANLADAADTISISGKQDVGAYGADLAVQVFQLFGSPRFYEVDLRYGIECGDDNLLLVFESDGKATGPGAWHERLRWSAPAYNTIGDAFGSFVLLTPLPGEQAHRDWRFVVAHGQPNCADVESSKPRGSRFDLDILKPTDDPAQPHVLFHAEHEYLHSDLVPRLATTEDTVEFRVSSPGTATGAKPGTTIYRYAVSADDSVKESVGAPNAAPTPDTAPASTSLPR